ncbi:lysophospholipid acyltransferase family protein [Ilumatobacter sp.]|uniref:lysophospholipid acyltransferase family protein n=1 Tax=Ilumatobacter sp. TaxID=1967498 RepID=UPI003B51E53F
MITRVPDYRFESAPELPGADRLARLIFGGMRHLSFGLWDFRVEGRENVPIEGPGIICPNHLSFCDSVFVPAALPRRVWAIGKGEYMDSWKTRYIFPAMGMIPVDRSGGDAAKAALDTAAKVLDNGHLFMIYPEGTRSRSGDLHKGRTGAARLALRCDAPIIPVGHRGTVEVQPPDSVVMKPRRTVTVRFGEQMHVDDFGDRDDPRTLRAYTDAVMFEISQLSGQTYVDEYAGSSSSSGSSGSDSRPSDEEARITPDRPSVVGTGPSTIPSPKGPSRPRGGSRPGGDGADPDTSTPPTMPEMRRRRGGTADQARIGA